MTNRRNLLKAGTSTLIGGLIASAGRAVSAQDTVPAAAAVNVRSVPPLAASLGMRAWRPVPWVRALPPAWWWCSMTGPWST
ncbi:hypothetical protein [Massilia sp. S19_KUP03_FR1]|uniref:hypothetical protein n=1 Tax=Massilia sp. S19_KUP03_FR1 TaxID=3025503 RepID=UPI002FCCF56F